MNVRYVITAINSNGQRTLAEHRQGRYTYETAEIAEQAIKDICNNTSTETITSCMGKELEVRPVECSTPSNYPQTCWFD